VLFYHLYTSPVAGHQFHRRFIHTFGYLEANVITSSKGRCILTWNPLERRTIYYYSAIHVPLSRVVRAGASGWFTGFSF